MNRQTRSSGPALNDSGETSSTDATATQWFVYLLRCGDGTLYTGIATNVERRIAEHLGTGGRGARYLRGRNPLELLLARPAGTRAIALRVERRIKKLSRAAKEGLLAEAHGVDRIAEEETLRAAGG